MMVEILSCGDTAFSVQFGNAIDRGVSAQVMGLHELIRSTRPKGVIETVPTFRSLLVHYDPLQTSQSELVSAVERMIDGLSTSRPTRTLWRLPVCYDPSFGIDLPALSRVTGLSCEDVVRVHTSTQHYVYMVGFAPGHPYMGDLPQSLTVPRREDPRAEVGAGVVATAIGMTVIYPFASPSGWHVIGRTPVSIFDLNRDPPALFSAGDTVLCQSIPVEDYERIRRDVAAGQFQIDKEEVHP